MIDSTRQRMILAVLLACVTTASLQTSSADTDHLQYPFDFWHHRSYQSVADKDAKLIVEYLSKQAPPRAFSSLVPNDWLIGNKEITGMPGSLDDFDNIKEYWLQKSWIVYVSTPTTFLKRWEDISADTPVLIATYRHSCILTGIYNKDGKNLFKGEF